MRFYLFAIAVTAAGVAATTALAQGPAPLKNDPRRPVAKIAADLGVTQEQFTACFSNVKPAPQGTRASAVRERANKAILLPCLREANPAITNARLDAVMDKYRPEGRVAGSKA
jgi:hypothetical protein